MYRAILYLAATSAVSAHSRFKVLDTATTNAQGVAVRIPPNDSPIEDVTINDMACNVAGSTTSTSVLDVTAGSNVVANWFHGGTNGVIDPTHQVCQACQGTLCNGHADKVQGPVIAYLKKVTDAATDTGTGDGWFKTSERGFDAATGKWGVDELIAAGGKQTIKIPSCLADGQYLLRAELIALHSASANSEKGAQFYPGCGQINISGGAAVKTPATVSFPGVYKATDPGIMLSIFYPKVTSYTVPGPAVFTCDGTSAVAEPVTPAASLTQASAPTTMITSTKAAFTSKQAAVVTAQTEQDPKTDDKEETVYTPAATTSTAAVPAYTRSPTTTATSTEKEMPAGTTLTDLLKWLNDIIATML